MANEGFLGKTKVSGERAATDDHPVMVHVLPLADSVTYPLPVGTLIKQIEVKKDGKVIDYAYADLKESDTDAPCAVVDLPCDPTGEYGEKSAKCVVHGTVKARVLIVDAVTPKPATIVRIEQLKRNGVFAV